MSLTFIKSSIAIILMMALTGCFKVELEAPDSVEQNAIFTMLATPKNNKGAVSYQWLLNDEIISADATHHTMLPALGEYTLTVVASDEKGNEDSQSKTISVISQPSLNPNFSFAINVSNKEGFAITEAPVTINGITVVTDQYGLAQFDDISQTSLMLVSASKEGYLTQAYQYTFDSPQKSATATLTLQHINPVSHTVAGNEAIDVTESELHTKLIVDANSFVDASGSIVTGEIDITITPIDIRAVDAAFLGGAQALTGSGEAVTLISTGMADYQFSQDGAPLSLAEGAMAKIEMDMVITTGDDGRIFVEGDTIEMWWFDSEKGLWIEDGVGTVELSETSETGLKLVATVHHFTTWNWDYYKKDDRSSILFKCTKDGQSLDNNESCEITASSQSFSRQMAVGSEGVTAINTPPNVAYTVTANTTDNGALWFGKTTFTSVTGSNTVIVDMASTPTKTGYIQCRVINEEVTNVSRCDASISTGSIGDQQIDTGDDINFRAPFDYVEGDVLEISSTIGGGLNRNVLIDTATVNGILDLEIIFDISFDGIEDNLYTFECVDEFGTAMDCNIIWYDRFENVIFDGKLSELSDPNSPWPDGKIYIESPEDGFGEAWLPVGGYYFSSESASVNTVTKVIKFVLISIPV